MATGQSHKSATLPPRTQAPRSGSHLSSPSFNRSLFGRLVKKLRFRNRDNDSDLPDSENVEGLYFRRKLSPESRDDHVKSNFTRNDVRRSQSDRSYQRPVDVKKKTGAFSKLRKSRNSKEIGEDENNTKEERTLAKDLDISNDFILSVHDGIDLDNINNSIEENVDEMDPGYETLDEVREKMRKLKLKNEQTANVLLCHNNSASNDSNGSSNMQKHRRTQSSGDSQVRGEVTSRDTNLLQKDDVCNRVNISHTDISRPNSHNMDMMDNKKNHLSPHIPSNMLSSRSGSCPIRQENEIHESNNLYGQQHKSETCLSKGGIVWKVTEDVYANPSIVQNKSLMSSKLKSESDTKDHVIKSSAIINQESFEIEAPPLPARQYDLDGEGQGKDLVEDSDENSKSLQKNCTVDCDKSESLTVQSNQSTICNRGNIENDTLVKSYQLPDEKQNFVSPFVFARQERIYEEIKDTKANSLHLCAESAQETDRSVSLYPIQKKERPYAEINDLEIDCEPIAETSSTGTEFFSQIMSHYDSLNHQMCSSNSCQDQEKKLENENSDSCKCYFLDKKQNLECDEQCETISGKPCCVADVHKGEVTQCKKSYNEKSELRTAISSCEIKSTDFNSGISLNESKGDTLIERTEPYNSKLDCKSEENCSQVETNSLCHSYISSEILPLRTNGEFDLSLESTSTDTSALNMSVEQRQSEMSYEDDADRVLESLQSAALPEGSSSIENLLDYKENVLEVNETESHCNTDVLNEDSREMNSNLENKNFHLKIQEVNKSKEETEIKEICSQYSKLGDDNKVKCNENENGNRFEIDTPWKIQECSLDKTDIKENDSNCLNKIITDSFKKEGETSAFYEKEDNNETCESEREKRSSAFKVMNEAGSTSNQTEKCVEERLPFKKLPSFYYEEEPIHMSLSELGMEESEYHVRDKSQRQKTKGESRMSAKPEDQSDRTQSQNKVRDSSYRQTAVHKNPAARRTYPMGMATSLNGAEGGVSPLEEMQQSLSSADKLQSQRELKSKSSVLKPSKVIIPEIPKFHRSETRCRKDFMESMQQLKDCGWYWGPLSWEEAEIKLLNKPDGSFLVRDSSDERYILSLSFNMSGHVHHTRIEHHKGKFSFWSQPDSLGKSTIKEFIEQCVRNSRNGQFLYFIRPSGPGAPPMPVHLLHPISRFKQMKSLQHTCRFQILQIVRRDHIDQLPIPTRIKDYLRESQYYVENLED